MAFEPGAGSSSYSSSRKAGRSARKPNPPQRRASPPQRRPSPPQRSYSPPSSPPQTPRQSGSVQSVTKPKPKPPGIKGYLAGDEVYQQAVRGGKRSLQDFLSELTRRRGEAKTNFAQTSEQMELDKDRQLEQMRDEFASRGLIHSGLFGEERGNFLTDFQTQMDQLEQANSQLLGDILSQETNYRREQELAMEAARQEALARRASRYNIGL